MKIPNNHLIFVADNKITNNLLSETHETGKHKAYFFKYFGFDLEHINTFRDSLIQRSIDRDIEKTINTDFGIKYELKCQVKTPDGRNPCIITIGIVRNGEKLQH